MAENKKPIEMDVTVTYHIESFESLTKDIAGALLALVELKSDVERKMFVSNLFSGLYKKPSEEAPSEETTAEEAPSEETAPAEENDHPYMVNVFEDAKKRQ